VASSLNSLLNDNTLSETDTKVKIRLKELVDNYALVGKDFCSMIATIYMSMEKVAAKEDASKDSKDYALHLIGELKRVWQCECVKYNKEAETGGGEVVPCPGKKASSSSSSVVTNEDWCTISEYFQCAWVKDFGPWEEGYRNGVKGQIDYIAYPDYDLFICNSVTLEDFSPSDLTKNLLDETDQAELKKQFVRWQLGCLEGLDAVLDMSMGSTYARYSLVAGQFIPGQQPLSAAPRNFLGSRTAYAYPPTRYHLVERKLFAEGIRVGIQLGIDVAFPPVIDGLRYYYSFICSIRLEDFTESQLTGMKLNEDNLAIWVCGCENGQKRTKGSSSSDTGLAAMIGRGERVLAYKKFLTVPALDIIESDRDPFAITPKLTPIMTFPVRKPASGQ